MISQELNNHPKQIKARRLLTQSSISHTLSTMLSTSKGFCDREGLGKSGVNRAHKVSLLQASLRFLCVVADIMDLQEEI